MTTVPDEFNYNIPPLPDIVALRAERPAVELTLALLEDEARAWIVRTWPYGGPACFGVRIIHEGDWALHHDMPESLLRQCSRGVDCRGWDLTHRFNEHGCREVLFDCPVCGPAR